VSGLLSICALWHCPALAPLAVGRNDPASTQSRPDTREAWSISLTLRFRELGSAESRSSARSCLVGRCLVCRAKATRKRHRIPHRIRRRLPGVPASCTCPTCARVMHMPHVCPRHAHAPRVPAARWAARREGSSERNGESTTQCARETRRPSHRFQRFRLWLEWGMRAPTCNGAANLQWSCQSAIFRECEHPPPSVSCDPSSHPAAPAVPSGTPPRAPP
jgi:hypothetical protein